MLYRVVLCCSAGVCMCIAYIACGACVACVACAACVAGVACVACVAEQLAATEQLADIAPGGEKLNEQICTFYTSFETTNF